MPHAFDRKQSPISMRLAATDIAVIDRAAALRGRSRTDFVREAAVRAAEDALLDAALPRLSAEDFAAFMAALSAPPAPVAEIVDVLRRQAPWEKTAAS